MEGNGRGLMCIIPEFVSMRAEENHEKPQTEESTRTENLSDTIK
jgi:hypothetical protein